MLKSKSKKLIKKLAQKYKLKLVMLYGSAAKDKLQVNSDIDLAILGEKDFFEKHISDFNYDMMDVEEIERRNFDIVPISGENPILLYNIFNDGIPVYIQDEEEYCRIRCWARFTYEDNKRFFYGRDELIKKRLKNLNT